MMLSPSAFSSEQPLPPDVFWSKLRLDWENYDNNSLPDQRRVILQALSQPPLKEEAPKERREALDFVALHLGQLKKNVLAGQQDEISIAFRLLPFADEEFAEDLHILLGRLLDKNPRLFLEELRRHRSLVKSLTHLLKNLGSNLTDRPEVQRKKLLRRKEALQEISEDHLQFIKNECLSVF